MPPILRKYSITQSTPGANSRPKTTLRNWQGASNCWLIRQVWAGPAIRFSLVSGVLSWASTSSFINRTEMAFSSAEFFIKAGCRSGPTSWTLSDTASLPATCVATFRTSARSRNTLPNRWPTAAEASASRPDPNTKHCSRCTPGDAARGRSRDPPASATTGPARAANRVRPARTVWTQESHPPRSGMLRPAAGSKKNVSRTDYSEP